jgi:hypothetical protein
MIGVLVLTSVLVSNLQAQLTWPLGPEMLQCDEKGVWQIRNDQQECLLVGQVVIYGKNWNSVTQDQADITVEADQAAWRGTLKVAEVSVALTQKIWVDEQKRVMLTVQLTPAKPVAVEDIPSIRVRLPMPLYEGKQVDIGKRYTLPVDNQWGWSKRILLEPTSCVLNLQQPASLSIWYRKPTSTREATSQILIKMKGPKLGEDKLLTGTYETTLQLVSEPTDFNKSKKDAASSATSGSDVQLVHRREVYEQVFSGPQPWSLISDTLKKKVADQANQSAFFDHLDQWLDRRSLAAFLLARVDDLNRAQTLFAPEMSSEYASLATHVDALSKALYADDLSASDQCLADLQTTIQQTRIKLEKTCQGNLLPETGHDIFTWIKAWSGLWDRFSGSEYDEPTPDNLALHSGWDISIPPAIGFERFTSSWTGNGYEAPGYRLTFSVLTPMQVFDADNGRIQIDIANRLQTDRIVFEGDSSNSAFAGNLYQPGSCTEQQLATYSGFFLLKRKNAILLCLTNRKLTSLQWDAQGLSLVADKPLCLGWVNVPDTLLPKIVEMARFYQAVLQMQPVGCSQLQRGDLIEQRFVYQQRESDFLIDEPKILPLPHLLSLSLEQGSSLRATVLTELSQSPDGWRYAAGTDMLQYRLPARSVDQRNGMNVYLTNDDPEVYKDLRSKGCDRVRLVCGQKNQTDWQKQDHVRQTLIRHLAAMRDAGIKAVVGMHNAWAPFNKPQDFSDPNCWVAFDQRWQQILDWCKPYQSTIEGYDLINEPKPKEHVTDYFKGILQTVAQLKALDPDRRYLVSVPAFGNPVGFWDWQANAPAISDVITYHDYWPHLFTHQKVAEYANACNTDAVAATHYPAFMPPITWTPPSWDCSLGMAYWDQWKCYAVSLPVLHAMIRTGATIDCGEFGVVGFARKGATRSGVIWLTDAMNRFERMGITRNVWAYHHGGFTWKVPAFKQCVEQFWESKNQDKH